ncbi:MAG: GGDEF domain-containing protein [Ruminococcus sp.]|nr:GGDEF domain-containing protein [Ruminococcus sp.]
MYSYRVAKANEEVRIAYDELVETNRIIREKDEKLIYLAYYDVLIGLSNRQLFVKQIDEMISHNPNESFTVILANIDDFKRVIAAYGHNTGDIIISEYIEKLCAILFEPVIVNSNLIQRTMSFGVSSYPNYGKNSAEILRNTGIAVTNAKMTGRGRIFFLQNQQQINQTAPRSQYIS